jgi:uncharacterized membrane protein YphA (DoxX/SURF4 family)
VTVAQWAAAVSLAALFAGSAIPKLTDGALADFTRWGYPDWFMAAVGLVELAGAAAVLVPRLARTAAAALGAILVGALGTVVVHAEYDRLPVTLLALALVLVVGLPRQASTATLVGAP